MYMIHKNRGWLFCCWLWIWTRSFPEGISFFRETPISFQGCITNLDKRWGWGCFPFDNSGIMFLDPHKRQLTINMMVCTCYLGWWDRSWPLAVSIKKNPHAMKLFTCPMTSVVRSIVELPSLLGWLPDQAGINESNNRNLFQKVILERTSWVKGFSG